MANEMCWISYILLVSMTLKFGRVFMIRKSDPFIFKFIYIKVYCSNKCRRGVIKYQCKFFCIKYFPLLFCEGSFIWNLRYKYTVSWLCYVFTRWFRKQKSDTDFNDFLIVCQRGRQVHYFDIVVPFL